MHRLDRALVAGNLPLVQRLFDDGEKLYKVTLLQCHENCKPWLRKQFRRVVNFLETMKCSEFHRYYLMQPPYSQFVHEHGIKPLSIAAQIGDNRLIRKDWKLLPDFDDYKAEIDKSLEYAIEADQVEYIRICFENGWYQNNFKSRGWSPLMTAIVQHKFELADMLIELGCDINYINIRKESLLMISVLDGDKLAFDYICSKNPDYSIADLNGDTVLHHAYLLDNPAIRDELLTKSECSELKERKNLFGLYPGDDQSKLYYVGQSYVIPQMISYLKYKNNSVVTDTETQDMKRGLCNGFSFLFNFYASQGMRLYFYYTMAVLASTEITDESLRRDISNTLHDRHGGYKTVEALMIGWINDTRCFQDLKTAGMDGVRQSDRKEQLSLVSGANTPTICDISSFELHSLNSRQFTEIVKYLFRLPANTCFEFSRLKHNVSGLIDDQKQIIFFDPNIIHPLDPFENENELAPVIIDYKFILLGHDENKIEFLLNIYTFIPPNQSVSLDNYSLFSEAEIPKTQADIERFISESDCKFTQLHLATLFNSQKSIDALLNQKSVRDTINRVDCFGQSALQIAINGKNYPAIYKLVGAGAVFTHKEADDFIIKLSHEQLVHIVDELNIPINLNLFLKIAVTYNKHKSIEYLLEKGASPLDSDALVRIIRTHPKLIKLMLIKTDAAQGLDNDGFTALHYSCFYKDAFNRLETVLPFFPNASVLDGNGVTPLLNLKRSLNEKHPDLFTAIATDFVQSASTLSDADICLVLSFAITQGNQVLFDMAIKKQPGVNLDLPDENGKTCLQLATEASDDHFISKLRSHGASDDIHFGMSS